MLKVKYDMRSTDSASKEPSENNMENINTQQFENILSNNVNVLDLQLDLNSRFSLITNNEESKKSTHDVSSDQKRKDFDENLSGINDETNNSICSEFDLFDNNVVIKNVKAHTLRMNIEQKEEHYKRRSLTTKINNTFEFKSNFLLSKKK